MQSQTTEFKFTYTSQIFLYLDSWLSGLKPSRRWTYMNSINVDIFPCFTTYSYSFKENQAYLYSKTQTQHSWNPLFKLFSDVLGLHEQIESKIRKWVVKMDMYQGGCAGFWYPYFGIKQKVQCKNNVEKLMASTVD